MTAYDKETGEILDMQKGYASTVDADLVAHLAAQKGFYELKGEEIGRIEMELHRRARERGASVIYGKHHNYKIETENNTDWTKMHLVLEALTPEEKKEAYVPEHTITVAAVPEHTEVVPGKWAVKGTVMKLLRRHGDEAVAKADEATFPGKASGKLVDTEKKNV